MEQETRIVVISIIVEDKNMVSEINQLLHEYGEFIIGRMGLPYEKKGVNIISVIVDAPMDKISALSGKLGRLPGISAKALYSKR
ncbi:MAG: iron-only hydrogenase system regulator [Hungatella sp.]|nr:iron-only hydrogenase system regulator [Hungatella sp.]